MAVKLKDQSLEELYARDKISPTAEKFIHIKEDFSTIKSEYCNKVCKYPCKATTGVSLAQSEGDIDIVFVQDAMAPPDKWKAAHKVEMSHLSIIEYIMKKMAPKLKYRVLSSLKCKPTKEGQKVRDTDIKKCGAYLQSELQRLKPKAIVCLGTSSAKVLGTNKSVYTNRGEVWPSEYGPVIHSIHPKSLLMLRQNASGAMWGPDYLTCLKRDVAKAVGICTGAYVPNFDLLGSVRRYRETNIKVCRTIEEVKEAISFISSVPNRIISFDTETTSLDPWAENAKLLCIQFGWMVGQVPFAVVIPLWHKENKEVDADLAWKEVSEFLLSDIPKLAHNGKFDIKYIFVTKGLRVKNVAFDTMLLLHEINSGIQGNYGLKRAAWDFLYETGIAGYEDLLPALTKVKDDPDAIEEETEMETEDGNESTE